MQAPSRAAIARIMENMEKRNFTPHYAEDRAEALRILADLIPEGSTVAAGGSVTLDEIGAIDFVRKNRAFFDRYDPSLTPEERAATLRAGLTADVFLTSANAITEDGRLYNVDGRGSRVAPMLFGPDRVIVAAGINKIVAGTREAEERLRTVASPKNTRRLGKKTPCAETGRCMDCDSPDRICNEYVWIARQTEKGRLHVILIGEELGY